MKAKSITSKLILVLLLVLSCCVSVTGCAASKDKSSKATTGKSTGKKDDSNAIDIKYVGNSCFYITFPDGTRLVTDPYGSGYAASFAPFPDLTADVITVSHTHSDHTAGLTEVKGNPKIIQPADLINKSTKVGSVEITAYNSQHVANMGDNTIFVFKEGDFKIVHMGETDNIDSPEAKAAVKDADVILAYAGEYGTVKNKDSFPTLYNMNIKVLIPQHFSNNPDNLFYGQPTIDDIIKEVPKGIKVTKANEFKVEKGMEKQFVALSPIGNK